MPGYYRRRSYRIGYRRRPRRYVRRWFKRRMRRFVNGSSKSSVRVKVPLSTVLNIANVDNAGTVYLQPVCPFRWSTNTLSVLNSPLYLRYCDLYEEVKCIGAKVQISVATPIGTSTVPSLQIVTAWDRRCSNDDNPPSYSDLMDYGSRQLATAVNNSIAKLVRSCYASDLMEKAQWHDCTYTLGPPHSDDAYAQAGANVNFFSPGMWIGLRLGAAQAQNIQLQLDIKYYFSFRNPKYGGSASGGRTVMSKSMDSVRGDDDAAVSVPVAQRPRSTLDAERSALLHEILDIFERDRGGDVQNPEALAAADMD